MKLTKQLFLTLSLLTATAPMCAMEDGGENNSFFGKLWKTATEHPLTSALLAIGASAGYYLYKQHLNKQHLNNSLLSAACQGDRVAIENLLDRGADIEAKDNYGCTPLLWAVCNDHTDVALFLMDHGADSTVKDNRGNTPLHFAAYRGLANIVQLLIAQGADIETKNIDGRTPLLRAVNNGHEEVALLLMDRGADSTVKDNIENTLLHLAAQDGLANIAQLLIAQGAEIEAKNNNGKTPLMYAVLYGHEEVALLLLDYGAYIFIALGTNSFLEVMIERGSSNQLRNILQTAHYNPTRNAQSEGQCSSCARKQEALLVFNRQLPAELSQKILTYLPEDICNSDQLRAILSYKDIPQLLSHCPFAWFKQIYQSKENYQKAQFLDAFIPACVNYRLERLQALLNDSNVQEAAQERADNDDGDVIRTILDPNNVEQHRDTIEQSVRRQLEL